MTPPSVQRTYQTPSKPTLWTVAPPQILSWGRPDGGHRKSSGGTQTAKSHNWISGIPFCFFFVYRRPKNMAQSKRITYYWYTLLPSFLFNVTDYDIHRLIPVQLTFWVPHQYKYIGINDKYENIIEIYKGNPLFFKYDSCLYFLKNRQNTAYLGLYLL